MIDAFVGLFALFACSSSSKTDAAGLQATTTQATIALTRAPVPLAAPPGAPAPPAAPEKRELSGKIVLHTGDSMVGGPAGLSKALEARFKAEGAKFVRDWQTSMGIASFDRDPTLKKLLHQQKPDIVILTLGANDVFIPFPDTLKTHVQSIVTKIAPRECYWMAPALWGKPDSGVLRVIQENAAPCKYFDGANLTIQRAGDGIHPTNKGGEQWAAKFWDFFSQP